MNMTVYFQSKPAVLKKKVIKGLLTNFKAKLFYKPFITFFDYGRTYLFLLGNVSYMIHESWFHIPNEFRI